MDATSAIEAGARAEHFGHVALGSRPEGGHVLIHDRSVGVRTAHALAPALVAAFTRHGSLALAGAQRLGLDAVSAHGASVVHPKGFVRHGRGAPRGALRFDEEADAIDAGVAVVTSEAFAEARGEAILDPLAGYGALALLALSLEIRRRQLGRVVSIAGAVLDEAPHVDAWFEREGLRNEIARGHFAAHFGFAPDACDLQSLLETLGGDVRAGLRWNARIWGADPGFAKYDERGAYHWNLHATHDPYRRRADALVAFLTSNLPAGDAPVADVGAGDALFAGLVARQGPKVVAIDPEPRAAEAATHALAEAGLGGSVEVRIGTAEAIDAPDGHFRGALLLDVIEHLRNPVRALAEIRRVLTPGGALVIATPAWRFGSSNDPVHHLEEYREEELARQVSACGLAIEKTARIRGAYDDLVVLARA